jgi:hypothetical protein
LDGQYDLKFAIYDAAEGGAMIWPTDGELELHEDVTVSEGLFSVGLGSRTTGGIPTTVWSGDRYLQVWVESEELSPRELLRSVPVAGMALTVPDGAITDDKLAEPVSRVSLLDERVSLCDSNNSAYPTDGDWHNVDVSEKVPDTAKAVIVQIGLDTSTSGGIHVSPGGEHQIDYLSAKSYGGWDFHQGIVKVIDGQISYRASPELNRFWILMIGYIE